MAKLGTVRRSGNAACGWRVLLLATSSLAVSSLACGEFEPALDDAVEVRSSALTTYATKALFITDLKVVRDPGRTADPCNSLPGYENRVWTIGHMLIKEAARKGKTPNNYVTSWLDAWATSATVNGQSPQMNLLSGPMVRSNWPKDSQNNYLLHKAPFRLLAIVNRLDLRSFRPFGEPLGGEIRFIFAPIYGTNLAEPSPDNFCMTAADDLSTIILEYSPAKGDENAVVAWAKKWHALGPLTGSTYRTELAKLTEELLDSGRLLRIRTNEGPGAFWQLTEFEHNGSGFLARSTIKQSPTEALHSQSSTSLGGWIRDNESQLQGLKPQPRTFQRHPVAAYALPNVFPGTSTYLRGSVNNLDSSTSQGFWNATNPGMATVAWQEARHLFSLATCSGCHGKETGTGLLHVKANNTTGVGDLSAFLNGPVTVNDPVSGTPRQFNEMARREEDLNWLVTDGAVGIPVLRNSHAGGQSAAANYKMVFAHSLKCLDVDQISMNDNALIKQYTCHGGGNQRIAIVAATGGGYNLVVKHSQKCLDVQNDSTSNLAPVVQKTCDNSSSQRVSLSFSASRAGRRLWFEHSGKCLQVQNLSNGEGAQVVQETCPADFPDNRTFKFVE